MGGGGCFGGGYGGGAGYPPSWRRQILDATASELKERGIEPPKQECNCLVHIVITTLVCAVVFMIVWEIT